MIIAGDICPLWDHDRAYQARWLRNEFTNWLEKIPAKRKIGIAGNHDFALQSNRRLGSELPWIYLEDEAVEIEGLKFYGSPWVPQFGHWAWMKPDAMLTDSWDKIPSNTDVLITHGPMYGTLDITQRYPLGPGGDPHVGSRTLANRLMYGNFPNLKLQVHGHIHEEYGQVQHENRTYACVSHMDADYKPTNAPMEFEIDAV